MANIQGILNYLGKNCRFTTLPTYDELKDGLKVDEKASTGIESQFIIPLKTSKRLKDRKLSQVKKIASHLWGGNDDVKRVFNKIDGMVFHEMNYATTSPLRVKVLFSGNLEKTFYAKTLDERRLFGIELENILSPNRYEYSASGGGIYEDNIPGIELYSVSDEVKKDPLYLEELVKLDYRSFVMLIRDLNPEVNPHNCLLTKEVSGDSYEYRVRFVDFDDLFGIEDLDSDLVLSGRREEVIKLLGRDRYQSVASLEKEFMRKRYYQNYERLKELLSIIGSSDSCNRYTTRLGNLLAGHYKDPKAINFTKAKDMGDLLGIHLSMQLADSG